VILDILVAYAWVLLTELQYVVIDVRGGERQVKKIAVVVLALAMVMLAVAVAPAVSAKTLKCDQTIYFNDYGVAGHIRIILVKQRIGREQLLERSQEPVIIGRQRRTML